MAKKTIVSFNLDLEKAIQEKGLKKTFIADRVGIHPATLTRILKVKRGHLRIISEIFSILNLPQEFVPAE
ncbi:MAG: hypothetical protein AMQ22_00224 [Candidatus Methanofastidiosum methylothiophilum]|uniref:HTH cro/C1-type domain-containing protein n=1 Tax=Candidatus Methanofastidiosum methylothiophilum TaxID=1705564 RepID=A0A150IT47_9EURY|nr:MAG: hypothetical protein APG11_00819 [Candidatus Methanofastidiosum methylthiophilus]KYC53553.1 MAG: hypothetical protein AMQ22_00224 [Candidatus Methanofastidiosum methylthiophilus]